jgi:type 2 lantibiotic biosynthesis protein LanM
MIVNSSVDTNFGEVFNRIEADKLQSSEPFEEVWLPIVQQAVNKVLKESVLPFKPSVLDEVARGLLHKLVVIGFVWTFQEFKEGLPFGLKLRRKISSEQIQENLFYGKFVANFLTSQGMNDFFNRHPEVKQQVTHEIRRWHIRIGECLKHLRIDQEWIESEFGVVLGELELILDTPSDPHCGGRTVMILQFSNEMKIVYKPRNQQLQVAWKQHIDWVNQNSPGLGLRAPQTLDSDTYGWVEFIESQPQPTDLPVFWWRAGAQTFWMWLLGFTDGHYENFVFSGNDVVLIDAETLLSPGSRAKIDTWQRLNQPDSLLFLNVLPNLRKIAGHLLDNSGLGGGGVPEIPKFMIKNLNTDGMRIDTQPPLPTVKRDQPRLGSSYIEDFCRGFQEQFIVALDAQDELLSPSSPCRFFQHSQGRFLVRDTQAYQCLLDMRWQPGGLDKLKILQKEINQAEENEKKLLESEFRELTQGDIPLFSHDSTDLICLSGQRIKNYFAASGFSRVRTRLRTLSIADLKSHLGLIRTVILSSEPKIVNLSTPPVVPLVSQEDKILTLQEEVQSLGLRIQGYFQAGNWLNMYRVGEHDQFSLRWANSSLYDGWGGILLFLAALNKKFPDDQRTTFIKEFLEPRMEALKVDPEGVVTTLVQEGHLGLKGVGSLIYVLTTLSAEHPQYLLYASLLVECLDSDTISQDEYLDVMTGVGGLLLATLKLASQYGIEPPLPVTRLASLCGERLLACQKISGGIGSWQIPGQTHALTGFAHGAAGVALALARLYKFTNDARYLEAAIRGILYENSFLGMEQVDWPDLRVGVSYQKAIGWCNGSVGIGLSRLGLLQIIHWPELSRDLEMSTRIIDDQKQRLDSVCCGVFGQTELLQMAAEQLEIPDWQAASLELAYKAVINAQERGYRLIGGQNFVLDRGRCGFYQGLSGVGYQLLRLLYPQEISSVTLME